MTDDLVKTCRHCKTAFHDTFPRMNCACGKNDGEPSPVPAPAPSGDPFASDPYGYDMAPGVTPDAAQAKWQDVTLNDPQFWWL
ncbi:MAG: hypothetical protein NTZ05_07075 [Chloroflexi bacterium]|nr:hypothetical protein [Chloroflexota bacterium]